MTSRELRTRRRAEERRQKKILRNSKPVAAPPVEPAKPSPEFIAQPKGEGSVKKLAANEKFSSKSLIPRRSRDREGVPHGLRATKGDEDGPRNRTPTVREGVFRGVVNRFFQSPEASSPQNAFLHGLDSKQLTVGGESPLELDALRASLRSEHQPANTTEEILVDELAQHFWRMRRFRRYEANAWNCETTLPGVESGLMALIQRSANSAERSFHKTLVTLAKLQKERGFVPQKAEQTSSHVEISEAEDQPQTEEITASGFVPSKIPAYAATNPQFVRQNPPNDGFVPQIDSPTAADTLRKKGGHSGLNSAIPTASTSAGVSPIFSPAENTGPTTLTPISATCS